MKAITVTYTMDEHGNPVPEPNVVKFSRWFSELYETGRYVIRRERIVDDDAAEVIVSSIFLGMNVEGTDPPTLWETMILGGRLSGLRMRWQSRDMALFGCGFGVGLVGGRFATDLAVIKAEEISKNVSTGKPDAIQINMHMGKPPRADPHALHPFKPALVIRLVFNATCETCGHVSESELHKVSP